MQGIPSGFVASTVDMAIESLKFGRHLLSIASANLNKGSRVNALFFGVMGTAFILTGAAATYMAFPSSSCPNGELWEGHCYPFPHGHEDCPPGSMVFDPERSRENEHRRRFLFYDGHLCTRGIGTLTALTKIPDTLLVCLPNGNKVYEVQHPMKDIL